MIHYWLNIVTRDKKKKKVFSTLNICSIIFGKIKNYEMYIFCIQKNTINYKIQYYFSESLRKIKKYKDFNAIDVEMPIKVFIAGAKFRLLSKPSNQLTQTTSATI